MSRAFWQWVHDKLEYAWHWVYYHKLAPPQFTGRRTVYSYKWTYAKGDNE